LNTLEQLRAGQLAGSRRLKLSCALTAFPREIFDLAETLEILDLSGNALASLPADLPRLRKLRILFCSANRFTELPEILGQCPRLSMVGFRANRIRTVAGSALPPALRWLVLTDNQLGELPAGIGRCTQLQKLMLAGNRLRSLPREMAACTRLELLRLSANRLTALPEWLFSLPRLAWLAYAGNPLGAPHEPVVRAPIADIAWDTLHMGPPLGEGASGVIHRAQWRRENASQDVAVKLFKGALTSDGLPQSEMNACLRAGTHPNLISVLGKLDGHPAGTDGLVMPLIAPRFSNLAAPPSLDSCTRDVYAADTRFGLDKVLSIALGVASATRHLHAQRHRAWRFVCAQRSLRHGRRGLARRLRRRVLLRAGRSAACPGAAAHRGARLCLPAGRAAGTQQRAGRRAGNLDNARRPANGLRSGNDGRAPVV
jgi:hypothetical protein